jgi:heptosyltransferase III
VIPSKIILIRPDRLGDVVLSLPVAKALKDNFPACKVYYLAARGPAGIKNLANYIDGWIIDSKSSDERLGVFELSQLFHEEQFDCLIELKASWRTAEAGFISAIPMRIGTSRRFYSFFYNTHVNLHRRGSGRHQTDLDLSMLQPLGLEIAGLMPELKTTTEFKAKAKALAGGENKNYIVIHPGSSGSAPNWPKENYIELARMILKSKAYKVVITGTEEPAQDFDGCTDLRSQTGLDELSGVCSSASLFISGSTGTLHFADALGVKCLSFFVDNNDIGPARWGPRRNLNNVIAPPGGPCKCSNLAACRCLETITPQSAFNKIESILGL